MAIFEYTCAQGHITEEWFSLASDAEQVSVCKTCNQPTKKRAFSIPSYVEGQTKRFKGTLRPKTVIDHTTGKTHRL